KKVCRGCAVRGSCLHAAMANGEVFGIWGGLDSTERRELRKRVVVALLPREAPPGRRTGLAPKDTARTARVASVAELRIEPTVGTGPSGAVTARVRMG